VFRAKRKHILLTLLSLEYIVLGIFLLLILSLNLGGAFFSFLYLGFRACEGALGLSILVTIRRTHGGDNFNLFNLNYDNIVYNKYRGWLAISNKEKLMGCVFLIICSFNYYIFF